MQGILSEPKQILDELVASRDKGNAIGIWAGSLGPGLHMCVVENIYDDEIEQDKVIILKEKDLNGVPLQAHVLFRVFVHTGLSRSPQTRCRRSAVTALLQYGTDNEERYTQTERCTQTV